MRIPPIWVVSLRRSPERRASVAACLSGLGLPFEFVDAADGRDLSPQETLASCNSSEAVRLLGRDLTPGEIGCSLSHLRLYHRLVDSGLEDAVILEDDVIPDAAFSELLRNRDRLPDRCELLHFHTGLPRVPSSIWGARTMNERHRCVRLTIPMSGCFGYLIRRSGAEKLLKLGEPVRMPADVLCGGTLRAGVRIYGIDPPLVRHKDSESTMPEAYALRASIDKAQGQGRVRQTYLKARERAAVFYKRTNPFLAY
jgi:glycosyl transferase, family 25